MSVDLKPTSSGVTSMNASSTGVQKENAGPYYDFKNEPKDTVSFGHRASKAKDKPELNDDPSTKGIGNRPGQEESTGDEVDRELAAIDKITQDAMGGPSSSKGKNGQNSFDL